MADRPTGRALAPARERVWNARDLVRETYDLQQCPVTGIPWAAPALWMLTGSPGSGKSTLGLQIAAQRPRLLVVSAEEGPGPALARRLALADLGRRVDVKVCRSLDAGALARFALDGWSLVIDSVNVLTLQPSDLRALADGGAPFILYVCQHTKDGRHAGSNAWAHEADVRLDVGDGRWTCTKSRFCDPAGRSGSIRGVNRHPAKECQ